MPKLTLVAQKFDAMMNNDQMAFELLQSGVDGFIKAHASNSRSDCAKALASVT